MFDPGQVAGSALLALIGALFQFLQEDKLLANFSSISMLLRAINESLATRFNIPSQWIVNAELGGLFFFGLGMMQIGEYAVAVVCWAILTFIGMLKAVAWKGAGNSGLHAFLRVFSFAGVMFLCAYMIAITNLRRGDELWSNLQKLGHKNDVLTINYQQSFVNMNRDFFHSLYYWVSYPTLQGRVISPVAVMTYLDITNMSPHPETIRTYSLSIHTRHCDWISLIPIDFRNVSVFFIYNDITKAMPLDFRTNGLNYQLDDAIPSHQSIHGWLIFDTTTKCKLENEELQYRFHGDTFSGNHFDETSAWGSTTLTPLGPRSPFGHTAGPIIIRGGDAVDLSKVPPVFFAQ